VPAKPCISFNILSCMKKLLPLFCLCASLSGFAQTDVIVLEKKGENVKTFAAGMDITMETIYQQWFQGTIALIKHDSIFINGSVFHYKEIAAIRTDRKHLNYQADGTLLMAAGGGVLLLGAVNGLIRHDNINAWYTTTSYITSGALLLLGYLCLRSTYKTYMLGKKFTLQYLALSANKN
jgi:hypothetical protein